MALLPFISLGIGIILGLFIRARRFYVFADKVMIAALIFLMLTIGVGIGLDESIIRNALKIGINCVVISLLAIFFSVLLTVIAEKTVLPLKAIDDEMQHKKISIGALDQGSSFDDGDPQKKKGGSHLVWIMPLSVAVGLVIGILLRNSVGTGLVDNCLKISLVILYVCVGISVGANKDVFSYLKILGFRILWITAAIMIGSLAAGIVSGLILGLPMNIALLSAGGMSFYSITGAYMTDIYGLEAGAYGFIVNIMREVFTILLMPLLIKISPGSPIAGGAAGDMDTMLAPITKFVGVRLGLVTLITGTILTFIVPILLPVMSSFF